MHLGEKACEVVNGVLLLLKNPCSYVSHVGLLDMSSCCSNSFHYRHCACCGRKLQGVVFEPGVLDEVFTLLQLKVQQWKSQECECYLTLDEMAITPSVEFDQSNVTVGGCLWLLLEDNLVRSLFGRACVCYNWYLLHLRRRKS